MPPHVVLGISADATIDEIKAAYRRLARAHHPDRGGDHDTFIRIKKAYEELIAWRETGASGSPHHAQNGTTSTPPPPQNSTASRDTKWVQRELERQLDQMLFRRRKASQSQPRDYGVLTLVGLTIACAGIATAQSLFIAPELVIDRLGTEFLFYLVLFFMGGGLIVLVGADNTSRHAKSMFVRSVLVLTVLAIVISPVKLLSTIKPSQNPPSFKPTPIKANKEPPKEDKRFEKFNKSMREKYRRERQKSDS